MSSRFIRSCTILLTALLVFLAPVAWALADSDTDGVQSGGDYGKKAQFIFSFAKYVLWPQRKLQANAPLVIGIVGTDPFGDLLSEAAASPSNGRSVQILHVEEVGEMRKCHILFVSHSEGTRIGTILSEVRGDNVLTVGESDKFLAKGGIINFVQVGNDLKFQISASAAKQARLTISSNLLALGLRSSPNQ